MKTWKIVTIAGLAVIVAGLIVTTAFAYAGGQAISATYGTHGSHGSYGATSSYGTRGSMMGGGYAAYGSGQYPNGYSQQGSYPQQQALGGSGGCSMRNAMGWP